ncbi:hypothetical protein C6Y45_01400 [Alkalicoccus saliphilus]|uniref:Uncharacterized protein n=1 Tax=Alkalicoccus saliphilus TaxID=200989 RepID=A0A2T4UB13_9BACI|nr:hypothetical protein C6Y45_01400 [Alkalicoccus saliphilus]
MFLHIARGITGKVFEYVQWISFFVRRQIKGILRSLPKKAFITHCVMKAFLNRQALDRQL